MKSTSASFKNFYIDTVRGRPSAETFNGIVCIYSLLHRRMEEYFKGYELTPVKFNTLLLLKHMGKGEGLSQNELCRHLIVSPSNVTRLIDRLIADGYVQRQASRVDRRINLIRITARGTEILDKLFHGYGEMIQQSVYLLDRSEVEQLAALLLKWFGKLNAADAGRAAERESQ